MTIFGALIILGIAVAFMVGAIIRWLGDKNRR